MSQANNNQNPPQGEDIVDTIAQYDLDEDFPEYANEQNKELNQIVSKICLAFQELRRHFVTPFISTGSRKSTSCCPTWFRNRGASGETKDPCRAS